MFHPIFEQPWKFTTTVVEFGSTLALLQDDHICICLHSYLCRKTIFAFLPLQDEQGVNSSCTHWQFDKTHFSSTIKYQVIFYRLNGGNENAGGRDWWIINFDWTWVNCRSEFLLVCDRDHLASFAQVIWSLGHLVIWSLGPLVIWFLGHLVIWSLGQ